MTIYPLDENELSILECLEWDPTRFHDICEQHAIKPDNMRVIIGKMVERRLVWANVTQATFMITHDGLSNLRSCNRRAHKKAKQVSYHEEKIQKQKQEETIREESCQEQPNLL